MDYLKLVDNDKDRNLIREIASMGFDTSLSELQIKNFVLNDIEFPTEYGKYVQTKLELKNRVNSLIDLYFGIREDEIKIRQKNIKRGQEEQGTQFDKSKVLDVELIELEIEKLEIKMKGKKRQVKSVLKELKIFYTIYNESPNFRKMSAEELFVLEASQWSHKTMNMPNIFEERYGSAYMEKALGKEIYDKYAKIRKEKLGLLPREIFNFDGKAIKHNVPAVEDTKEA